MSFLSALNGSKTYILAALAVVYAISGFITGNLDANTAFQIVGASGMFATIRHGIANQ